MRPKETRGGVTKEAADKFSTIALRLQGRDTPENVAHLANQLVFCFFAHSVKLLPNGLVTIPCAASLANSHFSTCQIGIGFATWKHLMPLSQS